MDNCDEIKVEEEEVSVESYTELLAYPRCNNRKRTLKKGEHMDNVKSFLMKRFEDKPDYEWLGKQVVLAMKSIKNKKNQRDTAWKIQTVLREASLEDASTSDSQS